jgi:hypothetical protein
MKKIIFLAAIAIALTFSAAPALAVRPPTCTTIQSGSLQDSSGQTISTGYDQWGYNYQAHMFNGWYDNYARPQIPATGGDSLMMAWNDAWLSNKSCDGNLTLDRPSTYRGSGAWLTNHASGTYDGHNVTGSYVVAFELGGTYNHDLSLTVNNGQVTGAGSYPAGSAIHQYEWVVDSGTVTGNTITLTAHYTLGADAVTPLTVMHMTGTINPDGSMSGTWTDDYQGGSRAGTWSTTSGNGSVMSCSWSDFVKIVAAPTDAYLDTSVQGAYGEGVWYTQQNGTEIGPAIWGDFAVIQEVSNDPCGQSTDLMNFRSDVRSGLGHW